MNFPPIDPRLKDFATEVQGKYIDAFNAHGSYRLAGTALGVNHKTVFDAVKTVRRAAALRGYSPDHDMTRPVPDGFVAKGVSTYYNKDGKPTGQWVKSSLDEKKAAAIRQAAFEAMAQELPRLAPTPRPAHGNDLLCNVYTLTDSHVGMLAWHRENMDPLGDWDLTIAERTLVGAFEHMVASSPQAGVGIVAQLGDFLHSDGLTPVTPTSGHVLDQDGRFSKVVATAIRILRHLVGFALQRHDKVVVLMAEGNHDLASSIWLRAMFRALYENEPRVHVVDSELPYYAYQHGETMLCWHHGHLSKNDQLPILFASQFPRLWGATTKRYAHCGHRHHVEEKEHSGITVIQHPTLASRDAYASRGGWQASRAATAITYHAKYGQVARQTVTPEMLEDIPKGDL